MRRFLGILLFVIALSLQPHRSALQEYRSECRHAAFNSYVAVMDNCSGYLHCMGEKWFAYECPMGTHFEEQHQICALDGPQFVCHRPNKMQHEDKEEYVEEGEGEDQQEVLEEEVANQQEELEEEAEDPQEELEEAEEDQREELEEAEEDQREELEEEAEEQQETTKEPAIQSQVNENQTEKELQKPPLEAETPVIATQPNPDNNAKDQVVEAPQSVANQTVVQAATNETGQFIDRILGEGNEVPFTYHNIRPLNCSRSAVTYHAYPLNCGYYYRCWHGYLEVMSCSLAYGWDHKLERCLPLDKAQCYGQ